MSYNLRFSTVSTSYLRAWALAAFTASLISSLYFSNSMTSSSFFIVFHKCSWAQLNSYSALSKASSASSMAASSLLLSKSHSIIYRIRSCTFLTPSSIAAFVAFHSNRAACKSAIMAPSSSSNAKVSATRYLCYFIRFHKFFSNYFLTSARNSKVSSSFSALLSHLTTSSQQSLV